MRTPQEQIEYTDLDREQAKILASEHLARLVDVQLGIRHPNELRTIDVPEGLTPKAITLVGNRLEGMYPDIPLTARAYGMFALGQLALAQGKVNVAKDVAIDLFAYRAENRLQEPNPLRRFTRFGTKLMAMTDKTSLTTQR